MSVLVTGGSGFVGTAILARLISNSARQVRASVRRRFEGMPSGVEFVLVGDLADNIDWSRAVSGINVVVHTAARVHVMSETSSDPLEAFRRVNVDGTLTLARQAAAAGVRRFIYLSSIKVNGEETTPGKPFHVCDEARPLDPYGISKMEAELGLRWISSASDMEIVIIRPALVYGPGVGGNFLTMMQWLHRRVPLPLGAVCNKRSFIALDNLADLILTCAVHPAAANKTFLAADGEDLSTPELLTHLGGAMNRPARLFSVSPVVLHNVAAVFGKRGVSQRLCGWLQVDISATRDSLNWSPVVTAYNALRKTARHFAGL